jgi:hypothetical protein
MLTSWLLLLPVLVNADITTTLGNINDWGGGRFEGHFKFAITEDMNGWEATITFSEPVANIKVYMYRCSVKPISK